MAKRPLFISVSEKPFVSEVSVDFEFFSGFSMQQKQRSIASLHANSGKHLSKGARVLEVSSKSPDELGVLLSAFNLTIEHRGFTYSVESAFQASKVFEFGGPYSDLLGKTSRDAKKDPRLGQSGKLMGFKFFREDFPLVPRTFFYDWLYVNALNRHRELASRSLEYDAFTDIEFNPARSLNCQARSAALCVGLTKAALLEQALDSPAEFMKIAYSSGGMDAELNPPAPLDKGHPEQVGLF